MVSFDPSLSTEVRLIDGWIDAVLSLTAVLCPACAQLVASSTPESPPPDSLGQASFAERLAYYLDSGGSSTKYQTPYLSRALLIPCKSGSNLIFTEDLHRKNHRTAYHITTNIFIHANPTALGRGFSSSDHTIFNGAFSIVVQPHSLESFLEPRALLQECCRSAAGCMTWFLIKKSKGN